MLVASERKERVGSQESGDLGGKFGVFQLGESRGWSTFGEQGKSWDLSQLFHRQGALVFR